MNRHWVAPALLWLATAATACAAILGVDDFTDAASSGGAAGLPATGSSTGGSGGTTATGVALGGGGAGGGSADWHHGWSKKFDSSLEVRATSIAIAQSTGHIVIGGHFRGTVDFGGPAITSEEDSYTDGYLARLDSSGTHAWTARLGSYAPDYVEAVATDPSSDIWVAGHFENYFAVIPPSGTGASWDRDANHGDIFVVKLDAGGNYRWGDVYGDATEDQAALGAATDSQGNVFVTGRFRGQVNFGHLTHTGDTTDAFILGLDSGGERLMDAPLGHSGWQHGLDAAVGSDGFPVVVGRFTGEITSGNSTNGGFDVFIVKYDLTATRTWVRNFGDAEAEQANAVAMDGTDIIVAGQFRNQLDADGEGGSGPLVSSGGEDAFVLRMSGDGDLLWRKSFGGDGTDIAHDVAVTPAGQIVVTGEMSQDVTFDGCELQAEDADVFVLVLTDAGDLLWCRSFGGPGEQIGQGVAVDSSGSFVLHGDMDGPIDFGGGELTSAGEGLSVFVAKFVP